MQAAIDVALSQVGWVEFAGDTDNPWGEWDGPPYTDSAYCGQFLSWVLATAGVPGDWKGQASQRYVPSAFLYWSAIGRQVPSPQPGDLVLFDWPGTTDWLDHIEFVVRVTDDGWALTVGANTGSPEGVVVQARPPWLMTVYVRPSYTDQS